MTTDKNNRPGISPAGVLEQIDYENIKNKIPNQEYDFVDFFCGAGGMSYGFHQMADLTGRLRWAGAIDIDKHAIDTYEHNYGHRPQNVNLGEAEIEEIRNALDLKEGNELILIGCAPCQGFSSHRKKDHRGPDKRNTLIGRFAEIAVELKPKMIIMENVPDLLAKKHWHHYQAFKDTVEAAGYHIAVDTGEILITILSSIAQQESDSISKNVRLGIQYLMQQGKPHLNTVNFLGLTKGKNQHELVIVPEEAALVRRIYREFLEGYSPGMIAGRLTADQIKTPAGKDTWFQSTVDSILKNEKYCGDLLMQKWYVVDFLSHKIARKEGALPQYFVEDHHEPIIPKDVYYQVQGEIQRRSLLKYDPGRIRFGDSNALKGRLFCGICGRVLKEYKSPGETTWRCRRRTYTKQSLTKEVKAGCDCRIVPEKEVKAAIIKAFNSLAWRRDELVRMQGGIWEGEIKRIDEQIIGVQEQQARLGERLDNVVLDEAENGDGSDGSVDDHSGEAEFLRSELDRLEMEYTRLVLERSEAANREVQIRILLELVDAMRREAGAHIPLPSDNPIVDAHSVDDHSGGDSPACYDYDEFFRRTSYVVDEGMIGDDGKIMSFSNDMFVRYLEKVVVLEDCYEVWFKAGVSARVPV